MRLVENLGRGWIRINKPGTRHYIIVTARDAVAIKEDIHRMVG